MDDYFSHQINATMDGEQKQPLEDEAKPTEGHPTQPDGGLVLGGGRTIKLMLVPDQPSASPPPPVKKKPKPHPQDKMSKFWNNFDPEYTGQVTRILPDRLTKKGVLATKLAGETAHRAVKSYENARDSCIRDVKRIIKECRGANQRYTDSRWDIERDLKITRAKDCLLSLTVDDSEEKSFPADAKRVTVSRKVRNYDLKC